MNLFLKIRLFVILSLILLAGILLVYTGKDKEKRVEYILKQSIRDLDINYRISDNHFKTISENVFYAISNDKNVLELLYQAKHASHTQEREKIRNQLYTKLEPFYRQLTKSGVNITTFSFENNHTFLRLHKPSKFDDDLSPIRYSFTYVNEHKKPVHGFEQGKVAHAFRNIYPIFYKEEYLGSVDIAFSTEALQEGMLMMNEIDTHFILNKKLFKPNIWESEKKVIYAQSKEHQDFLVSLTQSHPKGNFHYEENSLSDKIKKDIDTNLKYGKAFALYQKLHNKVNIITFSPIKNIKDEQVAAYLVSYTDSPYLKDILSDFVLVSSTIILGTLILAILICKLIRNHFFLQEEVNKKTQELKEFNEHLQHNIQKQLKEIREKDGMLLEQARLASMGEMIGNIAHQWRQPLNALGLLLQKLILFQDRGLLDKEKLQTNIDKAMVLIHQMSSTIDDFKNLFKEDRKPDSFKLMDTLNSCHELVITVLEDKNIGLHIEQEDEIIVNGFSNELSQVLLNIINNAKDALVQNSVENALVTVSSEHNKQDIVISICDNAGGIPQKIINKIFEPYFSTKEEGKGTGIGLFMSKRIIEEKMHGRLEVVNIKDGAKFSIILPQICSL